MKSKTDVSNRSLDFDRRSIYIIIGVFIFSVIFRFYYFDETVLLQLDSMDFFSYAVDIHTIGGLPETYPFAKQGWSIFLSGLFSIFNFSNTENYMILQKISSIIISSMIVFPAYLLFKKFLKTKYSIFSVIVLSFEPHLVYNSISGNSEPLYILCLIVSTVCFLSNNKKIIYISFLVAGISSIVRPEGLFLFIGFSIMFFIRFRKEKFVIPSYALSAAIFILVLTPIIIHNENIEDGESVFSRVYNSLVMYFPQDSTLTSMIDDGEKIEITGPKISIVTGIENFSKFFGWVMIPTFILLIPVGFLLFIRKLNGEKITILVLTVLTCIPAFYVYSYPLLEIKYLFFIFPFFAIFSGFTLRILDERIRKEKILFFVMTGAVIVSSIIFIDYKYDIDHEGEAAEIARYIVKNTEVITGYYPEADYIEAIDVPVQWSELKKFYENVQRDKGNVRSEIPHKISIIDPNEYDSIEQLIFGPKNQKLTHLVIDEKENNPDFLRKVYDENEELSYLEKIFDSKELGYNYKIKIFRINYDYTE